MTTTTRRDVTHGGHVTSHKTTATLLTLTLLVLGIIGHATSTQSMSPVSADTESNDDAVAQRDQAMVSQCQCMSDMQQQQGLGALR